MRNLLRGELVYFHSHITLSASFPIPVHIIQQECAPLGIWLKRDKTVERCPLLALKALLCPEYANSSMKALQG